MKEAAETEAVKGDDWWKDESGGGLKFGSGGGDGILAGKLKTRNPFKKKVNKFRFICIHTDNLSSYTYAYYTNCPSILDQL